MCGVALEREGQAAVNEVAGTVFKAPLTGSSGLPPIAKLQAGAFTAFLIELLQIRMAVYGRSATGDYNQLFESIESFDLAEV